MGIAIRNGIVEAQTRNQERTDLIIVVSNI